MNWTDAVAEQSGVEHDHVENILDAYGVHGPRPVPSRRRLHVDSLHFSGVKNLRPVDENDDTRVFEPFAFSRHFTTPITALVSDERNNVGKSSTLDILTWALRGRSNVRSDIKLWLRQVAVVLTIGNEQACILWRMDDGVPSGAILVLSSKTEAEDVFPPHFTVEGMREHATAAEEDNAAVYGQHVPLDTLMDQLHDGGAYDLSTFEGEDEMEAAVSDYMLDRLGLESVTQWRRNPRATDVDDGKAVPQGWPLWSQALVIAKPSVKAAIGETPVMAGTVLSAFLATEWTAARDTAKVRLRSVQADLGGLRRRADRDTKAREESVADLVAERMSVQSALDALPPDQVSAEEAARLMHAASEATAQLTQARRNYSDAGVLYFGAERALEAAELELAAVKEAAVTKRFWHSLKPSCCPRCDAKMEQENWEREQAGNCSLCNTAIDVEAEKAPQAVATVDSDQDDELDPEAVAESRVVVCSAEVAVTLAAHDDAERDVRSAEQVFRDASEALGAIHVDPGKRRELELRLSGLDGRIDERRVGVAQEPELVELNQDAVVLATAEDIAKKQAKQDLDAALEAVSAQIVVLGRALGFTNLDSAQLQSHAHLPVVRGGAKSNFGNLSDGERLRLKIALVVALLDVGAATGLGRHPGLLIVDSLAREEVNEANGRMLLGELYRVADTHGLQVFTSTTHSALVDSVLPSEAIVRPLSTGYMW